MSSITALGIMTGNSLDGADLVLTRFDGRGGIQDLARASRDFESGLRAGLRRAREKIGAQGGAPDAGDPELQRIIREFTSFIAAASRDLAAGRADVIGFHGQTCAHRPPSLILSGSSERPYTVQIGDGALLAELTGITVVYDFRSDDVMRGGEGAPLAPLHHRHLAAALRNRGTYPLVFCNAGNTSNLTVVSTPESSDREICLGWDAGPFNHFPDMLAREERGTECDRDGRFGAAGRVDPGLLRVLFEQAACGKGGVNFLLAPPPKSSDPAWYAAPPELTAAGGKRFEDRIRTAEYFSAYALFHSLSHLPATVTMPAYFIGSGGGWRNPVIREHFKALISGDRAGAPVLPEHEELFSAIRGRFAGRTPVFALSDEYDIDSTAMEARIFADAAVCRVRGEPFTVPETTGVTAPTVCGLIRFPDGDIGRASPVIREILSASRAADLTIDRPDLFDGRWSRASAGWADRRAEG